MAANPAEKKETVFYYPPVDFVKNAAIPGMDAYRALCRAAEENYEGFWEELARENVLWHKPFTKVLNDTNPPFYKWFEDGELNVSWNCLGLCSGGERGIRTPDRLFTYTRFPGVRLKPLIHLSCNGLLVKRCIVA